MPIVDTSTLIQGVVHKDNQQIYNGLDTMVTLEVFEELSTLRNAPPEIYGFARALQAPALEMMMRGFLVDEYSRREAIEHPTLGLKVQIAELQQTLQTLANAVWKRGLNPASPKQMLQFFYGAMGLPEQWKSVKGVRKLSMDRETLEKLEIYFHARPIIATILAIRDLAKQLSVLETEIDVDGRMRTSYNIAGTETGRWSSSANAFGTGTNLQNIKRDDDIKLGKLSLRKIFIADPGKKIVGIDLEQAESREVGWLLGTLFNEWSYLDACIEGDLHTTTCKLIWRNLDWTGDPKQDRKIAEQLFYRNYSYRDMSKRGGHGSNYYGTPFTMARHLKVPTKLMVDFQNAYFEAYPIPKWHRWTAQQLQTVQKLETVFGRERHFFGRPNDDTTLREAIAYSPQSATGDRLNLALWRIWKYMGTRVEILAQVHDALYFQVPESSDHRALIAEALHHISTPLRHKLPDGSWRTYDVPGEAKVGWNWGTYDKTYNPDGMAKWKGADSRVRSGTGLQRVM